MDELDWTLPGTATPVPAREGMRARPRRLGAVLPEPVAAGELLVLPARRATDA